MGKVDFELNAIVGFNRMIDEENDYIVAGGFTMIMDGKEVQFDFTNTGWSVDSELGSVAHINSSNLDYDTFEGLEITDKMLQNVTEIPEFFVYTGERGETDLKAVKLISLSFWTSEGEIFAPPTKVCKSAVVCGAF